MTKEILNQTYREGWNEGFGFGLLVGTIIAAGACLVIAWFSL